MVDNLQKNINNIDTDEEMPKKLNPPPFLLTKIQNPIWLSVSEAAKICGVTTKTIRRSLQTNSFSYKIVSNRYQIELASFLTFVIKNKKLNNKLEKTGIGQYIKEWVK